MKKKYFRHTIHVCIGFVLTSFTFQQCNSPMKKEESITQKDSVFSAINTPTQFVEKDNRKIAYRKIGDGPAMILCNRFRGTLDDWDPLFIDQLAKQYTVIIFDYSGIGLSTLKDPADSLTETKDVKDLADALTLDRFILGGWSHGGKVAQSVTAHNPQLVSHLILIGTGTLGSNPFPSEKVFFDHALKPVNDHPDEIVLFFEPKYESSVTAAKLSHDRISARTEDRDIYVTPEKFTKYFQTSAVFGADEEGKTKLATSGIPILVISGDHDIVFPIENWYALTQRYTSMQIIMLPQAGHGPQHQYPVLTANYMHNFITHQF